jgi:hypothetical protein
LVNIAHSARIADALRRFGMSQGLGSCLLRKCAKHRIQPRRTENRVASLLLALDQIDGQTSSGAVARADCN